MIDTNIRKLQDLAKIARDGAEFYEAAAEKVTDPMLRDTFRRQAKTKRELFSALSDRLDTIGGDTPASGTAIGKLHKVYADIKAMLSSKDAQVYVTELEAAEVRLLEHFIAAIDECDDPMLVSQLRAQLPAVHAGHDEMRSLKQRMSS